MKIRIFSTTIYVYFLFVCVISFMLIIDKTGLVLPMFFAVLLHESGHLLAMRMLGCHCKEIHLKPAAVEIVGGGGMTPGKKAIISATGPIVNILFFFAFYAGFKFSGLNYFLILSGIMLVTALFNLIPMKGLDGGELLYSLISVWKNEQKAEFILKILTVIIGSLIFLAGLFCLMSNPTISLIGIYFIICAVLKK